MSYGHLFNCTGLQADRVAERGVGNQYTLLPFERLLLANKNKLPNPTVHQPLSSTRFESTLPGSPFHTKRR